VDVGSHGWGLLGETAKYTAVSPTRFATVRCDCAAATPASATGAVPGLTFVVEGRYW
jgi:hypothetical protein